MKMTARHIAAGAVFGLGVAASAGAFAADPAAPGRVDATVFIRAHSAAVGVGYTWGDGELRYLGHRYPFAVKGIDVAAVGYSTIVGHGRVYRLHHLADFNGTYAASTGEATAGSGIGGQILVNAAGVQLRIDNVTKGARLSGAADGIQLALK